MMVEELTPFVPEDGTATGPRHDNTAYHLGFAEGRELLYQQMRKEESERPAPRTDGAGGAYLAAGAAIAVALGYTCASVFLMREERKKLDDAVERAKAAAQALDGL